MAVISMAVMPVALAQAPAQTAPSAPAKPNGGISLVRAVAASLKKNPDIQISETRIVINQGAVQAAAGPFDPLLNASTSVTNTSDKLRETNSSLGIQQQLRNGMVLGSSLTGQSQNTFESPSPGSAATLGVSIGFPLLRGRGEYFAAAAENVAKLTLQKSEYDMRHAASVAIYSTAVAYWNLRAAEEILEAQRESEGRAQRLIGDIQRLIKAGERPAADINLINASLTGKRVARLAAEQNLINARMSLSEKIGLDYADFSEATRASDVFPDYVGKTALIENGAALVQKAHEKRFDLKASRTNLDALRIAVDSARDNLKPILGLTIGANYLGRTTGENPLLVFNRRAGDPQLTAGLTYTWDVVNSKSKGNLVSQSASYDQQTVGIRALQLSIGAGVENAVAGYNRSVQQLAESQYTVDLYTKIVENEKTKLQLGSATLLDLVNVESQRQDALLNHISQRAAYASAIAALRYQIGELISDGPETQVLSMEQLRAYSPDPVAGTR
ncbi:MAG: TolC family protein [Pseudomonadota bacterium]